MDGFSEGDREHRAAYRCGRRWDSLLRDVGEQCWCVARLDCSTRCAWRLREGVRNRVLPNGGSIRGAAFGLFGIQRHFTSSHAVIRAKSSVPKKNYQRRVFNCFGTRRERNDSFINPCYIVRRQRLFLSTHSIIYLSGVHFQGSLLPHTVAYQLSNAFDSAFPKGLLPSEKWRRGIRAAHGTREIRARATAWALLTP